MDLTTKNEDLDSKNRDFSQDLATENGDSNLTHSEFFGLLSTDDQGW